RGGGLPGLALVVVNVPCSFCGETPVVAWFQGPDFRVAVDSPEKVSGTDEVWVACSTCRDLVDRGDREHLVERNILRHRRRHPTSPSPPPEQVRIHLDQRFWTPRSV